MSDNISGSKDELLSVLSQMDTTVDESMNITEAITIPASVEPTSKAELTPNVGSANVQSSTNVPSQQSNDPNEDDAEDDNVEEYLARFDKIESQNKSLQQIARNLAACQHDQARVEVLCSYVVGLQRQLDDVYAQLVDMNNILGK